MSICEMWNYTYRIRWHSIVGTYYIVQYNVLALMYTVVQYNVGGIDAREPSIRFH